ncbi:hypothetical protein HYH03_018190 [Edaphochlamys debaryana]|uniref:Uncharacterized protein n=1 Tax=Edaphochlamys debaryana TaxID=47281 RepID=A0A836BPT3_9CHLO|nr:hypothetical protein HYH03_018190 [Edaphochlamys debaryana]|eukprot:KAG2482908.1 hypothetical protein HYH03_018190 [Edaphochlamys debaryana]
MSDVYQHTMELLSVLRGFTNPTPLPTRELRLDAVAMLGQGLAPSLVAALPNLQSLELILQPSLSAALSGATQLTELALRLEVSTLEAVAPLSSLRSLKSLRLDECGPDLLAPLLSPLTALTSLRLGSTWAGLTGAVLAGLPSLAVLHADCMTLSVDTLAQLSSLTELAAWSLEFSDAGQQVMQATPPRCEWHLPLKLARVQLEHQTPEELAAISRSSPVHQLEWDITFELGHPLNYDSDLDALTERGEAVLAAAFRALAGRMANGSKIVVSAPPLMRPADGGAEVGLGRNHATWLEAVARAGVTELVLNCPAALTHQSLTSLASNTHLKTLDLYRADLRPFAGLMALAGAPGLEKLVLDAREWFDGPWLDSQFKPPSAEALVAVFVVAGAAAEEQALTAALARLAATLTLAGAEGSGSLSGASLAQGGVDLEATPALCGWRAELAVTL